MKRTINLRVDEQIFLMLNQIAKELNTTKTEIIKKSIESFYKSLRKDKNDLLKFAGILKEKEAEKMLKEIKRDRNNKDIELDI